jgi:GT2 family glycosyltransferase
MGRPNTTRRCLEALQKNTNSDMYDLVITSQNATHETIDTVVSTVSRSYEMILNEFNTGIALGHNQMMARRQPGQHYIKIDDDVIVESSGWIETFQKVLDFSHVGAVVARRPTFWIDKPGRKDYFFYNVRPVKVNGVWFEAIHGYKNGCVGCWWGISSAAIDDVGYFNEATGNDDQDWTVRAHRMRYDLGYIPDVIIRNDESEHNPHPQSMANKSIVLGVMSRRHDRYVGSYGSGVVYLDTRYKGIDDREYESESDELLELFKNFDNSKVGEYNAKYFE